MIAFSKVSHQIELKDDASHKVPSWALLTHEATDCVRFHEQPHPPYNGLYDRWACRRCALSESPEPICIYSIFQHVKDKSAYFLSSSFM